MALKKSHLYSSLWESANQLRGGMDASQYKDYVLTILFMKYVTDKYKGDPFATIVIPEGGSFDDMVALKGDPEIGDKINKIIARLAQENNLRGVIDVADFNDEARLGRGKEMVDRLSRLIAIFEGLDFRANRADGDDLLGDAYEYFMRHFATESGKSKGQFYTPAEVSRIMSKVVEAKKAPSQEMTVYDPTCGSGSLLLKVASEAPRGLSIFGQEKDNATAALARMNMILHDQPTAEIWQGNTLTDPHWKEPDGSLKRFDFVVANPPFSDKAWSNGLDPEHDEFNRFELGIPPAKNGDYAYLLHILASLKSTGKAAVILPHGVLFRGGAEENIRVNLVKRGLIMAIIGLPPNLFFGTGIPASIIVLDKKDAATRKGIFFIDASTGFKKDGNKNRLREQDIKKIVDVFTGRLTIERYSRFVPYSEIEANGYNLNIPRYIDTSEPEDLHDLNAHLHGGIPESDLEVLCDYWEQFPGLKDEIFEPASHKAGYIEPRIPAREVKGIIMNNRDFQAFTAKVRDAFNSWWHQHEAKLFALDGSTHPKALIEELGEGILSAFSKTPLLNRYDIYQILMDYWDATMQDDAYQIVQSGWQEAARLRTPMTGKDGKAKEKPDLIIGSGKKAKKYMADLIPPGLIGSVYFPEEKEKIEELSARHEAVSQELETFIEENSGEDSPLEEIKNDKGKITKANLDKRIKEIKPLFGLEDELSLLKELKKLMDRESKAKKAVKEAQKLLDEKVLLKYGQFEPDEIKELVVRKKWKQALKKEVLSEPERMAQQLATRLKELIERYEEPLPKIMAEVEEYQARVDEHLRKMGFEV